MLSVSSFKGIRSMTSTTLFDNMTDIEQLQRDTKSKIHFFAEVTSTMDMAREILNNHHSTAPQLFTVVADYQSKGRGTRGRSWKYGAGNLLMTVALHRSQIPIPLHLLPLRVGTLIASALMRYVTNPASVLKLKWPNDILINDEKVSGVLIEMENDHLLIGVGCNVLNAPVVPSTGSDVGRASTALVFHNDNLKLHYENVNAEQDESELTEIDINGEVKRMIAVRQHADSESISSSSLHHIIASEIVAKFEDWIDSGSDSASAVVNDFSRHMSFSQQLIRDRLSKPDGKIIPLYLNDDGTLHGRYVHDNSEVDLVTEYLY
jgi:hypothetical protein